LRFLKEVDGNKVLIWKWSFKLG